MNVNGVNIEYQYDGAHDARPTEHTLHGLDGLNLSGLDWMRLSHVCHLMAARDRKPKRAFVRVSGWTADRPNMRLIVDVLQDDDGTASVPLPLTSFVMPSHNDAHVSEPPALSTQIERTWGAGRNGRLQKHEPQAYRQPKPAQVEP